MKSLQVQVQKGNNANIYLSAELTAFKAFRRPTENKNKNINKVKQIYM